MSKKKTTADDQYYDPPMILGIGQYQSNSQPATGKTKHKHPIGFIRPNKVKPPPARKRRNAK